MLFRSPVSSEGADATAPSISRRGLFRAGAAAAAGAAVLPALGMSSNAASPTATFHGPHQEIVTSSPSHAGVFVSFDVIAPSRGDMVELLHALTDRIRILVTGGEPPFAGPAAPTSDNGILGPVIPPRQLSVAVGVGSSLFDARYGFAGAKPAVLKPMASFPDDNLHPSQCDGDLTLECYAVEPDTVVHALRFLSK